MRDAVAIYGATGVVGRLCAARLVDRGVRPRLVGRDHARLAALAAELGGLPIRVAPAHDRGALERALAGVRLVVSCAGPFLTFGERVLAAAIAVGAHYVDTSGEQAYVRRAYERFDALARRAGVTAVPSTAFEVAIGDLAAALCGAALPIEDDEPIDEVAIGYAIERFRPTAGTQSAAIASLAAPGVVWDEDRWVDVAPAAHHRWIDLPSPFGAREMLSFPSAEVVTVPRHLAVRRVEAFISPGVSPLHRAAGQLARAASPFLPLVLASPLGGLLRAQAAAPWLAGGERGDPRFAIAVQARWRAHVRRLAISGGDPVEVTAHVVAAAVAALLAGAPRAGVLAPAEALPAAKTLFEVAAAASLKVEGDG